MNIHLLIAPPAAGKTRACLERLQAVFRADPLGRAWALVPDQLQADGLRARLAGTGAVLPVRVATFSELHQEILEQAGASLPVAEEAMLHRLLQDAARSLCQAGQLPYYGPICGLPGFLLEVRDRIAELKRALVLPGSLADAARSQAGDGIPNPGLADLARIYAAYQSRLQSLGWADTEGLSWLAAEALQEDHGLLAGLRLLVVDGFDNFNPAQLQTLQLLAGRTLETWITLPGALTGAPEMQRAAHRRFARALKGIQAALPVEVHTLPGPVRLPPDLRRVEADLFEAAGKPASEDDSRHTLERIEARSPAEEAREALRWVKACILREGLPVGDCAVAVPDPDTYRAPLQAAADEFGLPLRFTQGPLLTTTPAAAAVADLLRLARLDYPLLTLLDTLRSPFFDLSDLGLGRKDAWPLEIASRYGQVVQGMAAWEETLGALASRVELEARPPEGARPSSGEALFPLEEGGEGYNAPSEADVENGLAGGENFGEDEAGAPRLPAGPQASRLLAGLRALAARLAPPEGELSIRDWTLWVDELLHDLKFFDCLEQAGETSLVDTFDRLLAELARSETLTGPCPVDYAGFLTEWDGLVAATAVKESGDRAAAPAVQVLRLLEARGVRVEALAVLGLAEGVFPAVERADPFISEEVRARLGMEPRLGQEQAGLFYQAITRADRSLLLTRPYLAKDGESWEPSPYWNAVQELLPGRPAVRIRPEDARPLGEAASPEELLFWAVRRRRVQTGEKPPVPAPFGELLAGPLRERWQQAGAAGAILASRLAAEAGGPYEGDLGELETELRQRYAQGARWSASRLEAYATCPFLFFASSPLELEDSPAARPGLPGRPAGLAAA